MLAPFSLETIVGLLRLAEHHAVADELLARKAAAATGGELVAAVSSRLLGLKLHYPHIYSSIKQEAEAWLEAGRGGALILPSCPIGGYV